MSRIGKKPVPVPSGVTATINGQTVSVKGPKGELSFVLNDLVLAEMTDDGIKVDPRGTSKSARSMWGMSRTMVQNIITGVSAGFEKKLGITGVGYRAQL
ncbi:50S ribosomal protein L6, partial [Roseibium sp.]|uniref:50S ribosomal protein L6 n=1 Tax=Roseibium sp. TaxID=1936156 RepID=UPI003A980327